MATTDTKKILEQDFTQQPQAMTQEDVNNQDARTRLWQSLDYSYGNQIRESDKSYDRAIAEADRRALARGMQRSSYNNQVLANMSGQKIEAQNNIRAGQIADYQNRIGELEQQEEDKRRWEIQQAFNEKQFETQQAQWREEFDYNKMSDDQKIAYNYIAAAAANGGDVSDELLARAGISRADYNAMKSQAASSGGGVGRGSKKSDTDDDATSAITGSVSTAGLMNALDNYTLPTTSTSLKPTLQVTKQNANDAYKTTVNGLNKTRYQIKPEEMVKSNSRG